MTRVKEHLENLAQDNGVIITEAQLSRTLQKEIDRLTAKNAKLIKAFEGCLICKDQYEEEIAKNKAKDKLIEVLEEESWDLRCIDAPTGGGDYDIEWIIVEHHLDKPKDRIIGRGKTPAEAIEQALKGK